ncbi:MAG: hypothetical protein M3R52_09085 [Acidobacteriota bacterium]|nr:hypothetical protein [Acidobacteriota bacterium]
MPKKPRRWLFIEQECAVPSEEGGAGRYRVLVKVEDIFRNDRTEAFDVPVK